MSKLEIANLEVECASIKSKHSELTAKVMGIDSKLSSLNNRVRSSKTHKTALSSEDYRHICNEQQRLKNKKMEILLACSELKSKLRDIASKQAVMYATLVKQNNKIEVNNELIANESDKSSLLSKVINLRDKWISFAEDQTRVNSMRVMAAQFSRELTELI